MSDDLARELNFRARGRAMAFDAADRYKNYTITHDPSNPDSLYSVYLGKIAYGTFRSMDAAKSYIDALPDYGTTRKRYI